MGLGETGVTWVCPACSRRVPMRVENCRCGGLRPERPSASPAARRVPEDAPREASQSAFDPAPGEPVEAPPPSPRFASPDGGIPRSGFDESLRHPGETARFWCSAVFAAAFWLFILITIIGVAYAAAILIFSLIARALFLGSVRGNGIEVSEHADLEIELLGHRLEQIAAERAIPRNGRGVSATRPVRRDAFDEWRFEQILIPAIK